MVVLGAWVVSPAVRGNHRGLPGCYMGTRLDAEGLLCGKPGKFPEMGCRTDMKVESSRSRFVLFRQIESGYVVTYVQQLIR